mmetsp:Transcript_44509/g.37400  ORF Transcript_44509/g.37400 Transcript_44509/m.37400 type:complete len:91 (-) Transcript_44509:437-709(-)
MLHMLVPLLYKTQRRFLRIAFSSLGAHFEPNAGAAGRCGELFLGSLHTLSPFHRLREPSILISERWIARRMGASQLVATPKSTTSRISSK